MLYRLDESLFVEVSSIYRFWNWNFSNFLNKLSSELQKQLLYDHLQFGRELSDLLNDVTVDSCKIFVLQDSFVKLLKLKNEIDEVDWLLSRLESRDTKNLMIVVNEIFSRNTKDVFFLWKYLRLKVLEYWHESRRRLLHHVYDNRWKLYVFFEDDCLWLFSWRKSI